VWTVANVTLHVGIGVGLAMLLREPWLKIRGVYRVLLILPWAIPNYITALIWKGMFQKQFGAINAILGLFGVEPISWFSQFTTAFAANLATNTWLGFPFMMVVTLGALQAIPRDLEQAAEVDGASGWQRFRHVTLPLLMPALLPAVILGSVWTFNMINIIYLVSGGEPDGWSEILISEAYRWAFDRNHRYGYAAAYAVLVFGVLLVYARSTDRWLAGGT
jgi:arabinogalactan oligomer/maltooligosaccharide transport system permease protein